ncbi:MAG: AraC family transcriptional regulator [Planctomycetota bacterium]
MTAELIFLHGACLPRCTTEFAKHWVGYHALQFMSSGSVTVSYDKRAHSMSGAWCWSSFPGPFITIRRGQGCTSWNHRYVAFTGNLVGRWMADGLFPVWPQDIRDRARFEAQFDELLELIKRGDRWGRRRGINLLERMLLELADDRTEENSGAPWLTRVLDAITNPTQSYDPDRLAKQLGISAVTLRRRFRSATGQSMHAYAVSARIATARRLLIEDDSSIQEIADRLGYRDVFFFSKQFRKYVGVPPALFRASKV